MWSARGSGIKVSTLRWLPTYCVAVCAARRAGRKRAFSAAHTAYSVSEQDLSLPPIMKFQQQQQQTHSDSSKMNILLILRKSENKRSI
jgi:hypothetical protein